MVGRFSGEAVLRWTIVALVAMAACAPTPSPSMGSAVSGAQFEEEIVGQVLSFRLPDGGLAEAQFHPDGTAIYSGLEFDRIGRWRPWAKGYCAYYPSLGSGPGLRRPFSGKVEPDGYHCYEVRADDGYFVLFQRDGIYAGTLVPVPG
jgi:hypothetical protein